MDKATEDIKLIDNTTLELLKQLKAAEIVCNRVIETVCQRAFRIENPYLFPCPRCHRPDAGRLYQQLSREIQIEDHVH